MESVAKTWAQRAQAERGAEHRFRLLSEWLRTSGAHSSVVEMACSAQEDEARHALVCAEVARSLGHASGYEAMPGVSNSVEVGWGGHAPKDRVLCEVVLMGCITETFNASLMNTLFLSSGAHSDEKSKRMRGVVQSILKDEVKHSQLGWTHLALEAQRRDCSFLGEHLGEMLEISVKDELFLPASEEEGDSDLIGFGVLPVERRLDQFRETLEKVVLPGFERFGVPTEKAVNWMDRKMGRVAA